jgi:uncharacterized protein YrzB (UPF0473 family)
MSNEKNYTPGGDDDVCVTVSLDNGETVECEILTIFECGEREYIVLLPVDEIDENEDSTVFIYRYIEDENGNPSLDNIESDEEFEMVWDTFDMLLDDAEFDEMD